MAKPNRSSTDAAGGKKTPKAPKTKVVAAASEAAGVVASGAEITDPGDHALTSLIAELEAATPLAPVTAVIETPADEHTDIDLHKAVEGAEAIEASIAAATPDGVVDPTAVPTPVKERVKRKHYTDKTERLKDRVGTGLADYTVLTVSDATDDPEAIKARMEETLTIIRGMNKKEQNRAGLFIEFISGKKPKLNEVLERTLKVLKEDGHITTGKDGNVMKNLLAKPYSVPSARAMSGNTISMFADLKVIVSDGKGRYVGNPDSTLLMKANSMLFPAGA